MKQTNDPPSFLWLAVDADIIVAGGNNGLTGNPEISHRLSECWTRLKNIDPNKPMNWAHWGPDPARVTSSHGPGSYQLTARSRGHALSLGKVPAPSHLTTAPVFTHGAPDVRRLAPPFHRLPLQLWFAPPANRLPLTLTVCPTSLAPSWLWHVLPHLNFGGREGNIMFEVITC